MKEETKQLLIDAYGNGDRTTIPAEITISKRTLRAWEGIVLATAVIFAIASDWWVGGILVFYVFLQESAVRKAKKHFSGAIRNGHGRLMILEREQLIEKYAAKDFKGWKRRTVKQVIKQAQAEIKAIKEEMRRQGIDA
ncbi:MAG: hypothetical protein J7L32_05255 [Thermoplasmata archaeon]|nr:hypothetical protein [Thermoplasmata archaeon]